MKPMLRQIGVLAFLLLVGTVRAGDYYVSLLGSDSSGNGAMDNPWRTIQYALDEGALLSSDTVRVHIAAGSYREEVRLDEGEEIYGGYDDSSIPWVRDYQDFVTVLNNWSTEPLGNIVYAADNAVVDGFEIVEANYSGIFGGGFTARNNVVRNCSEGINGGKYIIDNFVYGNDGDGIWGYMTDLVEGNVVLWNGYHGIKGVNQAIGNIVMFNYKGISVSRVARDNIVRCNNWAGIEAGAECIIEGNEISDTGWYAGIYAGTLNQVIQGNVVTRCYRGIAFSDGNPEIRNNIIAGCGKGIISGSGWPEIRNCIFWDNGDDLVHSPWDIKYCLTGEGYPGEGNISCDPKFVGWAPFTLSNPLYADVSYTGDLEDGTAAHPYKSIWKALAAYDFHLSAGSPCIGMGEGGADMGAYPGVGSYSPLCSPSARIDVLPGTYHEQNLHPGNRVWLRGAAGAEATIIEGTGDGDLTPRMFQMTGDAIVDGLTIRGKSDGTLGIDCEDGTSVEGRRGVVMNCIIKECEDGIISWFGTGVDVASCVLRSNHSWGVMMQQPSIVANCVSTENDAGLDTAWVVPGEPDRYRVRNCIIWGNSSDDFGGDESYLKYCDIGEGASLPTNFSANPKFTGTGNYHLRSDSPCRNRGTEELAPVFDFDGRLRGQGAAVDVGAYEYEEGWVWSFDGGTTEGWQCVAVPEVFAAPEGLPSAGGLLLRATSATNCFGYWQNDARQTRLHGQVAYVEDSVYELRWETQRAVSGPYRYPGMRLRVNSDNLEESTTYVINDTRASLTSGTQTGEYRLYLARPEPFLQYPGYGYRKMSDTERLLLAFDMLNFDPAGDPAGEILLDNLDVTHSRYAKDWTATPLMSYDFASGAEGWMFSGEVAPFTAPAGFWASGELALQSTTNTGCFGFWESEVIELPSTASQTLLCATFTVKSDEAVTTAVPTLRLRIIREDSSEVVVKTIESVGSATRSPGTTPRDYTICYWLPAEGAPHRLRLAFDLFNFDPSDSASAALFLDHVRVEVMSK
jgi:hypothetical protein